MGHFQAAIGGSLLVWLLLAWATAKLAGLTGMDYYLVGCLLSVIGALGAAAVYWWKSRQQAKAEAGSTDGAASSDTGSGDETDVLIKDAEARLAAAKVGGGAGIGNLPLVFVLGDQGSTKTSVVLNSGLEPELLAGQVYGDGNAVAPTRAANLWLAHGTVFAEAGARVLADGNRWSRFVRRLKPGGLKSVVGGQRQAPRAVVVCINSEIFTQQGAADQLSAMSRSLGERLGQISETLGISFPVYALFTRSDRLPFFLDYVRTLSNEEANEVVGATLPMRKSAGIYAEEEAQRLTAAFNGLFHSLCDKRVDFMPRETDYEKVPGAFEFPREFRKLRQPMVQFLVDLCRPSQLRVSPFLRGFYFAGVRPVTVQDIGLAAAPPPQQKSYSSGGSATGVFQVPQFAQPSAQAAAPQYVGTKRVPQWVFLPKLFHSIILQDRAAFGASVASTKTSTAQRLLLGLGSLLLLVLATMWTVSFFQNKAMIDNAVTAAKAIAASEAAGSNLASLDSLQRLETLRQALEQITKYKQDGYPFAMGFGLFAGDDLLPHVRAAYYNRFAQLLFRQAQTALVTHLNGLPVAPGPADDYGLSL